MKKCVNCGREIPDEARFCPHCESPQAVNPVPAFAWMARYKRMKAAVIVLLIIALAEGALLVSGAIARGKAADPDSKHTTDTGYYDPLPGLYDAAENGRPAGELIGMIKDGGEGPWIYRIEYASGEDFTGKTYYYFDWNMGLPEDFTMDSGYAEISVTRETANMLKIVFGPECRGDYRIIFELNNDNNFPLFFIDKN